MSGFDPYTHSDSHHSSGGFDNNDSQSGFKSERPTQFIAPVTIKMLNEAHIENGSNGDGVYVTHGVELSYVRFIGVIRNIDTQNDTYTQYKLEDGTGDISIRTWNNDKSDNNNDDDGFGDDDDANAAFGDGNVKSDSGFKKPKFSSKDYIEVIATVKEFNSKLQVQVQKLSKITDFNQIPYHLLSVTAHFLITKNGNPSATSASNNAGSSLFVGDNNNGSPSEPVSAKNDTSKPLNERIFDFITEHSKTMSDGVPMQFIAQEFDIALGEVEEGVTGLVEDGRIFSTTDDTQFLPL